VAKSVKAFLQAAIGPGQVDLNRIGYIPLSPTFQARVSTAVDSITGAGTANAE
jgi:phosphate transport system substrate-binding protein